jgi:hypothetical protein
MVPIKTNLILLAVFFGLGICWIIYDRVTVDRDHHYLNIGDELVGCGVYEQFDHRALRGVLLLCDTNVVGFRSPLLPGSIPVAQLNKDDWFWGMTGPYDLFRLKPPYSVSKERGSDTLLVWRAGHYYLFEIDHGSDRPLD